MKKRLLLSIVVPLIALAMVILLFLSGYLVLRVFAWSLSWTINYLETIYPPYYQTQDLADYGQYTYVLEKVSHKYITSFFPKEIEPEFQDAVYSFSSSCVDSYGFEVYLEFTFDSEEQFREHVRETTEGMYEQPFYFDTDYQEYILLEISESNHKMRLYDYINLNGGVDTNEEGVSFYHIDGAGIGKILVNESEKRVIYVSLFMYDGGGTGTDFLSTYFSRFNIDPAQYEKYTKELQERFVSTS